MRVYVEDVRWISRVVAVHRSNVSNERMNDLLQFYTDAVITLPDFSFEVLVITKDPRSYREISSLAFIAKYMKWSELWRVVPLSWVAAIYRLSTRELIWESA